MKLGIVIPYRNREEHLRIFVAHMKTFLKDIDYKIFIADQTETKPFNRGKLLNIGAKHAFDEGYDYIVLHDVDMIPLEADYSPVEQPTHMATNAEQFGWVLPANNYFGGVTLFDKKSFYQVNGFNNDYWGWGAEDEDLRDRVEKEGIGYIRRKGTYQSLPHYRTNNHHPNYQNNVDLLNQQQFGHIDYKNQGLSNLEYTILSDETNDDYRITKVEI